MRRLLTALVLLASLAGPAGAAAASSSREVESKVALESSLEKRLQAVLREALGTQDLIIIVNVSLKTEAEPEAGEILPGVPAKAGPSIPGALGLTMTQISRVSATIMVDEAASEKDVELVRKLATGILGIAAERGDALTIEKMKFHKPAPPPAEKPDPWRHLPLGMSLSWLLLAGIIVLILQRRFLTPLLGVLRDLSAAGARVKDLEGREEAEKEAEAQAPAGAPSDNGAARPNQPFSYLHDSDLHSLVFLLRGMDAASSAVVINYLPPSLASKALASLEPAARREVAALMSQVIQLDETRVSPLEAAIRKRIDYLMGGEDKLSELLASLPADLQKELLAGVGQRDAALAERLRARLIFIEDLANLEPAELKALSRRVPMRVLAEVLKGLPALKEGILPKLPPGMSEWLTEELELSEAPSPEALEAARRRLLDAFAQLVREGKAAIRRGPPAAGQGA